MASVIYNTFWSEWFWLPTGVTWKDLENKEEGKYIPQVKDLRYAIYLAIFIFLIRKILERIVFTKIGEFFRIKDRVPKKAPNNPVLEIGYKESKFPKENALIILSKQTDLTVRQVERWFRVRRNQDRPSMMIRFTEAAWRFTFYFSIFVYGIVMLWDKEWFADSMHCWIGYPNQYLPADLYWYYMIEMSFYWSLMFSQFLDVKRKDFWEMFSHHIATILLLTFSWSANYVRVGSLVLVIHDAVDYILEFAKLMKYLGVQKLCDACFAIFAVVWFITRLVIYPTKVLRTTWFECREVVGGYPSLFFFNGMLIILLILHIYWFSLICIVAYRSIFKSGEKQEITDIRSTTEEEVSEELIDDTVNSKNHSTTANSKNSTVGNSNHIAPPTNQSADCNHHNK